MYIGAKRREYALIVIHFKKGREFETLVVDCEYTTGLFIKSIDMLCIL